MLRLPSNEIHGDTVGELQRLAQLMLDLDWVINRTEDPNQWLKIRGKIIRIELYLINAYQSHSLYPLVKLHSGQRDLTHLDAVILVLKHGVYHTTVASENGDRCRDTTFQGNTALLFTFNVERNLYINNRGNMHTIIL